MSWLFKTKLLIIIFNEQLNRQKFVYSINANDNAKNYYKTMYIEGTQQGRDRVRERERENVCWNEC